MSFPRYPDYKDSGVAWLGEVPAHWTELRAKSVFREIDERSTDGSEELLTVSHITGVTSRNEKNVNMTMAESLDGYKKCLPGDLVINTMWAWMGALGTSRLFGIVSPSYNVYRPDSSYVVSEFFDYLCRTPQFSTEVKSRSTGVWESRLRLYPEAFLSIRFAIPPLPEQFSIVAFLDRETTKIDALVVEQERLIDLLKEKRQAVISHAVTKGLNPNVAMRDSGIEWLKEFPGHWSIIRLKSLIEDGSSISYGIVQPGPPLEDGVPFIQTTNMTSGNFDLDDLQRTSPEIASLYPRSELLGGEVVLGIRASIGAAHVVPLHLRGANLSRGVARIACSQRVSPEYLVCFLRSRFSEIYWESTKQGSTFNEVSIETVRELPVVLPPISEQEQIVKASIEAENQFGSLITEAQRAIDLLKERRAALISAAVTGQIDVRGLVADNHAPAERVTA